MTVESRTPEIVIRVPGGVDADPAARDAATRADVVHQAYASLSDFDGLTDVLVMATPVSVTAALLRTHAARLRRIPLVMDIGSVKAGVLDIVPEEGISRVFVGAHPVCGIERSGFDASRAERFDGAPVWLVADDDAPLQAAEQFWRMIGAAAIRRIYPPAHDMLVGAASHMRSSLQVSSAEPSPSSVFPVNVSGLAAAT
ncbi:MAG: prephenate dehydrogenase/arogenate dehydrogenase family protein [Longimicrobiales bacterium]